jgi:cysteinyl-tRNA synthetase
MVRLASDKMAKSLGNILDVERAVDLHGRNAVRMWLLQSHYSHPVDYSEEILNEKRRSYERIMRLYRQVSGSRSSSKLSDELASELRGRFDAAMQDNLNTSEAIAAVFKISGRAGQEISNRPEAVEEFSSLAEGLQDVLVLFGFDFAQEVAVDVDGVCVRYAENPGEAVLRQVAERERARREKDWPLADRIRDGLHADGWAIEDTSEGPILSRQ